VAGANLSKPALARAKFFYFTRWGNWLFDIRDVASVGPSCDPFCHLHYTRSDEERGHRFCLLTSFLCTTYVLIPAIMPILRHVAGTAAAELDHSGQESNVADEQTPSKVVPRAIIPSTISAPLSLAEVMHSLQTTGTVPGCRKVRVFARRQVPFSVWLRITRMPSTMCLCVSRCRPSLPPKILCLPHQCRSRSTLPQAFCHQVQWRPGRGSHGGIAQQIVNIAIHTNESV